VKQMYCVLDLKPGQRLYNKFTHNYGTVIELRETAPEWVDCFVQWDGEVQLKPLTAGPHIYIVPDSETLQ
jgi:hypothetical protein